MKTRHAVILATALVLSVVVHGAITAYYSPYNVCVRGLEAEGADDPFGRCALLLGEFVRRRS